MVKGTAKMKMEDDQDMLPDDLGNPEYEDGPRTIGPDHATDNAAILTANTPRSKSSSVSETPVVSVDKAGEAEDIPAVPLVNGDIKSGPKTSVPVVSINSSTDRDSGSISPRQHSLDAGQKLTYAQMAAERERAAAAAAELGHQEEIVTVTKGKAEEKLEKPSEAEPAAAKEAPEVKPEVGHAPVERQDSRSKHRPVAKTTSNQPAPGTQGEKTAPQTKGGVAACGPQPIIATSTSASATPTSAKPQGKRTDRPKSPPSAGGGAGAGSK